MKKYLLISSIALVLAGCGQPPASNSEPTTAEKAELAVKNVASKTSAALEVATEKAAAAALDAKAAVAASLADMKLTPEDIKAELAKGGRIVRSKAAAAAAKSGEMFDNARVIAVINAKLVADPQLSALKIKIDADQGNVILNGTAPSAELIGRAINLALETEGVTQVVSLLGISP